MTTTTDTVSWLRVGAPVVEYKARHNARRLGMADIVETSVERLTVRDVILANGRRYSRSSLRLHGPGDYYSKPELAPPTAERVIKAKEQNAIAQREFLLREYIADADAAARRSDFDTCASVLAKANAVVHTLTGDQA